MIGGVNVNEYDSTILLSLIIAVSGVTIKKIDKLEI